MNTIDQSQKCLLFLVPVNPESEKQWTIKLKMADRERSDFCLDFTMSHCALELKQTLISLPFEVIRLLNQVNRL